MPYRWDLLLKGGEVIDPVLGLRAPRDVAFKDSRVAAVEMDLASEDAGQVLDVSGKMVAPGLIDVHGHYFEHIFPVSAAADRVCLPNGVTTSVDAGSSGWTHFEGFKEYILSRQETRLTALINLSALGMMSSHSTGGYGPTVGVTGGPQTLLPPDVVGELQDLRFAQVEEAIRCIRDNPEVTLGVKVRIDPKTSGEANAVPALERGRQVADATDSFMMVHVARSPIPLAKVFEHLRPGDIVTHIFHSAEHNVLDDKGRVRPEVWEAKSNGIVMDLGAARANFGVHLSRAAIDQGLLPDTLGTDITREEVDTGPRYTMPDLMSLYMALGMSLEAVMACATSNPAGAIGRADDLGTLRVGAVGDAAVLEIETGDFAYSDVEAEIRTDRRFRPVMTIKDGKLWSKKDAALSAI